MKNSPLNPVLPCSDSLCRFFGTRKVYEESISRGSASVSYGADSVCRAEAAANGRAYSNLSASLSSSSLGVVNRVVQWENARHAKASWEAKEVTHSWYLYVLQRGYAGSNPAAIQPFVGRTRVGNLRSGVPQ